MCLLSAAAGGAYLLILFGLCFGGVVAAKVYGMRTREKLERQLREEWEAEERQAPPQPQPKPQQSQSPQQQAIYYIVEKKRAKRRADYAEPREIQFRK